MEIIEPFWVTGLVDMGRKIRNYGVATCGGNEVDPDVYWVHQKGKVGATWC
jgi:hypothetical protein